MKEGSAWVNKFIFYAFDKLKGFHKVLLTRSILIGWWTKARSGWVIEDKRWLNALWCENAKFASQILRHGLHEVSFNESFIVILEAILIRVLILQSIRYSKFMEGILVVHMALMTNYLIAHETLRFVNWVDMCLRDKVWGPSWWNLRPIIQWLIKKHNT